MIHPTVGSNSAQFARHPEENLQQKHRSHGSSHTSPLLWMQWIFRAIRRAPAGSEGCFSAFTSPAGTLPRAARSNFQQKQKPGRRKETALKKKNQECMKQQEAAGACGAGGDEETPPTPPPPSVPRTLREVTRRPTASRCLVASISPQWQRRRAVVEVTAGAVMTTLAPLTEL